MLASLIYASRAAAKMDYQVLRSLNDDAARLNAETGVTGLLIYGSSNFLQVLEGDRKAINDTYCRISRDARHHALIILELSEISERCFQDWAMKFVMLDGVQGTKTESMLRRFGTSESFDPFGYSGESAMRLLQAFSHESAAA